MAHYAEIDSNNTVLRVLVLNNDWTEQECLDWLATISDCRWLQTSYTNRIRGQYAGIGDVYDQELDIFVTP